MVSRKFAFTRGGLVVLLDEQPVLALFVGLAADPHQHPAAFHALAVEPDVQLALLQAFMGVAERGPCAAVPQHHRATAIFALRNGAFEVAVVQRMVFGAHRKSFVRRIEARPLGHGPAQEHAIELKAQVVMQPPGGVLLHDEPAFAWPSCRPSCRL
jgi:hypothetical protein